MQINKQNLYYTGSYERTVAVNEPLTISRVFEQIFTQHPKIVAYLFRFRDMLVKPLGLKPGGSFSDLIIEQNQDHILLNKEDKYLSFSILLECLPLDCNNSLVRISTFVYINNTLGKLYFLLIKPFHKVLCKMALKRI